MQRLTLVHTVHTRARTEPRGLRKFSQCKASPRQAAGNLWDFVNVCPAFGILSSCIKIVRFSMSRQQKWLHLALFSHGYIAIVCSSEACCRVGKVCSFMDTHTHALTHTYTFASGWFTLLKPTDPRPHDLSKPANRTIQVVAKSFQLLQHSSL